MDSFSVARTVILFTLDILMPALPDPYKQTISPGPLTKKSHSTPYSMSYLSTSRARLEVSIRFHAVAAAA